MRSNIASTCSSGSVPFCAAGPAAAESLMALRLEDKRLSAQLAEEVDQSSLLFLRHVLEARHRRRRVVQRALDRLLGQARADLRQVRPGTVVAVLAELV